MFNIDHQTIAYVWFGIIALVWAVYLAQDMFIMGASMLNMIVAEGDEAKRKQVQVATGLHSDGIEVWLIVALGGTFAAFPLAFATALESLYVPFFVLLMTLTARKISIEMIYKDDSEVWIKSLAVGWVVSSGLLMLILGVYLTNTFLGLQIGPNGYEGGLFAIFNLVGVLGGLLFVALAIVAGAFYINFTTTGKLGDIALKASKFPSYLVGLLPLFVMLGFNNKSTLFEGELFSGYPILWILPSLTIVFGLLTFYSVMKKKNLLGFVSSILVMVLFIATGFVGIFPNMIPSTIDPMYSVTIMNAAASEYTLNIMFIVALILVPLVIGYQAFKYVYFAKRVNPNDL
jgi:cytochrome d ubiquinol oxidase subunit II